LLSEIGAVKSPTSRCEMGLLFASALQLKLTSRMLGLPRVS
jgi:hypothetical protein